MENALRYHAEIDLSRKDTSHAQLIRLTGRNKDVLEVGPATGYVTKLLQERGCRVWCVEIDPEAAEAAAAFCERMVVGNVEGMDFGATFPDERFDVVTFGDVLEHLVDPLSVLLRVKDVLTPSGYVVASVPNIAHASIRLSLLAGRFDYLEAGLLDRTHLRFFTQKTLANLFADAGYEVRSWRRVVADAFVTEVELREDDFPAYLVEAVRNDNEAMTYQFVVKAHPVRSGRNGRKARSALDSPEENLVENLMRWQKEHEARESSLTRALEERTAALAEREERLAERERSLHKTQSDLDAITGSAGYELLRAYRQGVHRLFPARSWRGSSYRFLVGLARQATNAGRKKGPKHSQGRAKEGRGAGDDG